VTNCKALGAITNHGTALYTNSLSLTQKVDVFLYRLVRLRSLIVFIRNNVNCIV